MQFDPIQVLAHPLYPRDLIGPENRVIIPGHEFVKYEPARYVDADLMEIQYGIGIYANAKTLEYAVAEILTFFRSVGSQDRGYGRSFRHKRPEI